MDVTKQIILIISVFSVVFPVSAMNRGDGNKSPLERFKIYNPLTCFFSGAIGSIAHQVINQNLFNTSATKAEVGKVALEEKKEGEIQGDVRLSNQELIATIHRLQTKVHAHIAQKQQEANQLFRAFYDSLTDEEKKQYELDSRLVEVTGHILEDGAGFSNFDAVKMLISEGANIDACIKGETPLINAISADNTEIAKWLISQGASLESVSRRCEITDKIEIISPLHVAAYEGNLEVVYALVKAGASIDVKDHRGVTPLMDATKRCYKFGNHAHRSVVQALLAEGASAEGKKANGSSALYYASRNGDFETVKSIFECANFCQKSESTDTISLGLTDDIAYKKLAAHCTLRKILTSYKALAEEHKETFLKMIVPAIVEHRLNKIAELLNDPKLLALDETNVYRIEPKVFELLDPNNIEQHRTPIEAYVKAAFIDQLN